MADAAQCQLTRADSSILLYADLRISGLCLRARSYDHLPSFHMKEGLYSGSTGQLVIQNPPAPVGAKGRVFPEALATGSFS